MLNPAFLFALVVPYLLVAAPISDGGFATWNEVFFEVEDRPARPIFRVHNGNMSVTQKHNTEYRSGLNSRQVKLHLNEPQFRVLSAFFGQRMEWRTAGEIQDILTEEEEGPVENLTGTIQNINQAAQETFKLRLIMEQGGRYKMAVSSKYIGRDDSHFVIFQFGESNRGFIYHNKWIPMAESHMRLLRSVAAANGEVVPYQDIYRALGKTEVLSLVAQRAVLRLRKETNRAAIDGVGAPIIGLQHGGLSLRVAEPPALADTITHRLGDFVLVLPPLQRHVFETLHLGQLPLDAKVKFSKEDYFKLVLSPRRLKTIMAAINRQFVAYYGKSLVDIYSVDLTHVPPQGWAFGGYQNHFSRDPNELVDCESRLAGGPRRTWPGVRSLQ